jgi:hypothetical protein
MGRSRLLETYGESQGELLDRRAACIVNRDGGMSK